MKKDKTIVLKTYYNGLYNELNYIDVLAVFVRLKNDIVNNKNDYYKKMQSMKQLQVLSKDMQLNNLLLV